MTTLLEYLKENNMADVFQPIPVNISSDNKNIYIQAELAGLEKEDISIEHSNKEITIETTRKKDEDKTLLREEIFIGKLKRIIPLNDANIPETTAEFKNGILTLTVPKNDETKKITIS